MKLPIAFVAVVAGRLSQGRRLMGMMPVSASVVGGRVSKREWARIAWRPAVTDRLFDLHFCTKAVEEVGER